MHLGIVVERRKLDNPWIAHSWKPVAVIPGLSKVEAWRLMEQGADWAHFLCGSLPVTLHRKETEAYRVNLAAETPAVYVMLCETEGGADQEVEAVRATVSPYDAQDYLDSGEDIIEAVAMPDEVRAWIEAFVAEHHADVPFKKRKRDGHRQDEAAQFGKKLHASEQRFYDRRKPS